MQGSKGMDRDPDRVSSDELLGISTASRRAQSGNDAPAMAQADTGLQHHHGTVLRANLGRVSICLQRPLPSRLTLSVPDVATPRPHACICSAEERTVWGASPPQTRAWKPPISPDGSHMSVCSEAHSSWRSAGKKGVGIPCELEVSTLRRGRVPWVWRGSMPAPRDIRSDIRIFHSWHSKSPTHSAEFRLASCNEAGWPSKTPHGSGTWHGVSPMAVLSGGIGDRPIRRAREEFRVVDDDRCGQPCSSLNLASRCRRARVGWYGLPVFTR